VVEDVDELLAVPAAAVVPPVDPLAADVEVELLAFVLDVVAEVAEDAVLLVAESDVAEEGEAALEPGVKALTSALKSCCNRDRASLPELAPEADEVLEEELDEELDKSCSRFCRRVARLS